MIEIAAYNHANGARFGCGEAEVIALFGEPVSRIVNREGELEFHYPKHVARFDADSKQFRELTLLPGCEASLNGIPVIWEPGFLSSLHALDPDLVEVLGFILSLKMGLALSGFHDDDHSQMAVHAFREGDWDQFRPRMTPFNVHVG
jgi:hypothetical protein